jgi:hypothetical protein
MANQVHPSSYMNQQIPEELKDDFKREFFRYSNEDMNGFHYAFYDVSVLNMLKETVVNDAM